MKMFDKILEWWTNAGTELAEFNDKAKEEVVKYSNKQVKKTAAVCSGIGLILGLALGSIL